MSEYPLSDVNQIIPWLSPTPMYLMQYSTAGKLLLEVKKSSKHANRYQPRASTVLHRLASNPRNLVLKPNLSSSANNNQDT